MRWQRDMIIRWLCWVWCVWSCGRSQLEVPDPLRNLVRVWDCWLRETISKSMVGVGMERSDGKQAYPSLPVPPSVLEPKDFPSLTLISTGCLWIRILLNEWGRELVFSHWNQHLKQVLSAHSVFSWEGLLPCTPGHEAEPTLPRLPGPPAPRRWRTMKDALDSGQLRLDSAVQKNEGFPCVDPSEFMQLPHCCQFNLFVYLGSFLIL